ncbi:MAG: glycosyltransferase family 39 protein [Sporichthyaceae bacterium]|nr:glycosyltransferase family 39 protein [Sporichthyaceae bacterium]
MSPPWAKPPQLARPPVAWGALTGLAVVLGSVLVTVSGRYGYHRDELYFIRAGEELTFGYDDQPPLTPALARVATELFGESLVGLRLPSALAVGLVVVCTGLLAREFGGGRSTQAVAAACIAVSAFLFAVGHLLSTSTFDLLAWATLSWLVVRALRDGGRSWLLVGVAAGVGLQNKTLVAFLLVGISAGLLLVGPRSALRTPWPWLAAVIALVLWAPFLLWQAAHGWPQLEISAAIAGGSSGTSEPRWLFFPFQLVLVSPLLVPVWVLGLRRLATDPVLRPFRAFAAAYVVLAVLFIATGGKPYYLAGLFPILLAAGSEPMLRWVRRRGTTRFRSVLLGGALVLSGAVSAVLFLPIVPVRDLANTPIVDINYDAGETVGWEQLAGTVAQVRDDLPPGEQDDVVVLTRNYGQAGAIDRYRRQFDLPPAQSGHNSYAHWGPPRESPDPTIVVGYDQDELQSWFRRVELAGRIDNGVGLENDEQGQPVWVCRDRIASWEQVWPQVRRLG